jgi:hypothetical protein
MHGVPRCLSLRIGLLSLLATLVLTHTVLPILAEPTRGRWSIPWGLRDRSRPNHLHPPFR